MKFSQTTSTDERTGLNPAFWSRVVGSYWQRCCAEWCSAVLAWLEVAGMRWLERKGEGDWLVKKIGLAAIPRWSEYMARAEVGCPCSCSFDVGIGLRGQPSILIDF